MSIVQTAKRVVATMVLTALTMAAACGGSGYGSGPTAVPPADGQTVSATASLAFTPGNLSITAGQTVTFAFASVAHNVFFDAKPGAPADIAGNNANVSVARTFSTPGTYHYTCRIHPSMQGTVVVQ